MESILSDMSVLAVEEMGLTCVCYGNLCHHNKSRLGVAEQTFNLSTKKLSWEDLKFLSWATWGDYVWAK